MVRDAATVHRKANLLVPFEWAWFNYKLSGSPCNPTNCWKNVRTCLLLGKERRETGRNSSGIGECPWFFVTHLQTRFFLVILLDQVGFRNDMAVPNTFIGGWAGVLSLSCVVTLPWHVLHMCCTPAIRTTMASSSNGDVCLINDVSLRFPFLFTERKHAKNIKESKI